MRGDIVYNTLVIILFILLAATHHISGGSNETQIYNLGISYGKIIYGNIIGRMSWILCDLDMGMRWAHDDGNHSCIEHVKLYITNGKMVASLPIQRKHDWNLGIIFPTVIGHTVFDQVNSWHISLRQRSIPRKTQKLGPFNRDSLFLNDPRI